MGDDQGATEREIGAWEDRDGIVQARQVRGNLRIVKMRVPVPPAPMCPASTKITQTVHVLAEDDQVIKETSTMSWDVPYGDCFNVVIRDTFTLADNGGIR